MTVGRQLRAIGLLPFISAGVVPLAVVLLTDSVNVGWDLPAVIAWLPALLGSALIVAGLGLMHRTISLFARVGMGTLAPWDPPTRLVVRGPYRHVRNPMITGVFSILLGEAALLGSVPILIWFAAFFAGNAIWMPVVEEPALEQRFGEDYREYKRHVPRWIPRPSPWTPGASNAAH
jgi:protein-S-isoprenylcysteine O-methyltransferase Ste14